MRNESVVIDPPPDHYMAQKRYLRALVAVARSARRGEYAVFYLTSGSFFRTDRLGAIAMRVLIAGGSDQDAMEVVERIEDGAGRRARRLINKLDAKGALTRVPPSTRTRARLRRVVANGTGIALTVLGALMRVMPSAVIAWMFDLLLTTPAASHISRSSRRTLVSNLEASGYAGDVLATAARPRRSFNYVFMYLSVALSPQRLTLVVDRLFNREATNAVAERLEAYGATVGVFLHGPLCVAVPNILRTRGREVVRAVVPWAHGINVSQRSGSLTYFFGEPPEMAIDVTDPLATGSLLRNLNAGRSVYVALTDLPPSDRKPAAEIAMLGRQFPRNDGPAWLAVRSGRPLALWTTYSSPSGVVLQTSPLLDPDPSLPIELRVAALSTRLYACAEAAIREHPEAWRYWSYLNLITVNQPESVPSPSGQT